MPNKVAERLEQENQELKAEIEAVKNGYEAIGLLMDMQRACPVDCRTSISIDTFNRDPVVFRWEYKNRGQRMCIVNNISWLELQRTRGKIYFDGVTEKIKADMENIPASMEQAGF